MSNISPEMEAKVGTQTSRQVSYPVSASDIRRWALAVYYPDPAPERYLTTDESALVAPEEFNPFAWAVVEEETLPAAQGLDANDPDRTEKSLGIAGPGLKFMLNGGMVIEYGAPIKVGDVITSVSRLAGYKEREGRLGLMLFTDSESTWTNQRGEFVRRSVNTLIRY